MKETVLITGAAKGLGLELAKVFAGNGYHLFLIARNEKRLYSLKRKLEAAYKVHVEVLTKDLLEKDAAYDIFDYTKEKGMHIDILVNNTDTSSLGLSADDNEPIHYNSIQVQIGALMQLTRCCLNPMLEHGKGKILNVASISPHQTDSLQSVHYTTKVFVLSFTEALSVELKNTGVTAMALCPKAKEKQSEADAAKAAAEYGYRLLTNGQLTKTAEFLAKIAAWIWKLMPWNIIREVIFRKQK